MGTTEESMRRSKELEMKTKFALTAAALALTITAANIGTVAAAESNKGVTTSAPSNDQNSTQAPKGDAAAAKYKRSNSTSPGAK
jgi:hypothetical protein